MSIEYSDAARTWTLSGGGASYILHRDEQDRLLHLYWGPRLAPGILHWDPDDYYSFAAFDLPVNVLPH